MRFDNDLARELLEGIAAAGSNEEVRVLLLRGAGRAFCAQAEMQAQSDFQA